MTVEFRELRSPAELAQVSSFEKFIWNADDDNVGTSMMVSVVHEGGLVLGGFEGERLVATAFAFPTHERDVLHSHYIAVHPDLRSSGVGERIKHEQAAWCRTHGYRSMRWTFDPLQLANAHLNLNKLGALGVAYHANLYGSLGGINGDLPSDRLTVQWWFDEPRPTFRESVVVTVPDVTPAQIAASGPEAFVARETVRDAMAGRLGEGWRVTGVDRHLRTYTLER